MFRTHAPYTGPDLAALRAKGRTCFPLNGVPPQTIERAAKLIEDEAAALTTQESAKLLARLDDLETYLLFAHSLDEDTTSVHYVPAERAFYAITE